MEKLTSYPEIKTENGNQLGQLFAIRNGLLDQVKLRVEQDRAVSKDLFRLVAIKAEELLIQKVVSELEDFLASQPETKEVVIDDDRFLEDAYFILQNGEPLPLSNEEINKAKAIGKSEGADRIFSTFEPEANFTFGSTHVPFIKWQRRMAEEYFSDEYRNTAGTSLFSIPTRVPGASVQYLYNPDKDTPLRSLILERVM